MTGKKQELGDDTDSPISDGWELTVSDGHAGYGVYAHMTEYPEEGAILVLSMERGETANMTQLEEYRKSNPLGGPAKVFDAMADAIRAGDDYHDTLARYGYVEAHKEEQQKRANRIASVAAEELIRSEGEPDSAADGFSIPQCQVDGHMRDCIEHLVWNGEAASWETDDGYLIVRLGDFTLGGGS